MPEIRLVKKYPHIKDEDVTSIFQEGYIKGFENGRKGAIPIEWIRNNWLKRNDNQGTIEFFPQPTFEVVMNWLIEDWEKENGTEESNRNI